MQFEFVKSSSKNENKFVGLKISNNTVEVHYPEFFNIESKNSEKFNNVKLLIETIFENSDFNESLLNSEYMKQISIGKNLFYSYYWLIHHYFSGDDIRSRVKKLKKNQNGKINWKKTFESDFILSENNIFYLFFLSESHDKFDDELIDIYNYCLFKSINILGWLFKITHSVKLTKRISIEKSLITLINLLRVTFNEEKKLLIVNLITIIKEESSNDQNGVVLFGTNNFEIVFESLVFKTFNNVKKISDFYPTSYWVINNERSKNSNLRPDALYENDEGYLLIDAKYYRYSNTKKIEDLPRTESIQKQLTYQEFIELNNYKKVLYNLYIFPMIEETDKSGIKYIGYSTAEWKNERNKIHAVSINLNLLCEISKSGNLEAKGMIIDKLIKTLNDDSL